MPNISSPLWIMKFACGAAHHIFLRCEVKPAIEKTQSRHILSQSYDRSLCIERTKDRVSNPHFKDPRQASEDTDPYFKICRQQKSILELVLCPQCDEQSENRCKGGIDDGVSWGQGVEQQIRRSSQTFKKPSGHYGERDESCEVKVANLIRIPMKNRRVHQPVVQRQNIALIEYQNRFAVMKGTPTRDVALPTLNPRVTCWE